MESTVYQQSLTIFCLKAQNLVYLYPTILFKFYQHVVEHIYEMLYGETLGFQSQRQ